MRSLPLVLTGLAALAGIGLRFCGLDRHDAWVDEGISWSLAHSESPNDINVRLGNGEPPLIHLLLRPLASPTVGIGTLRIAPAFFGSLALLLWIWLLRRHLTPWAAALGSVPFSLSAFQIYYSQELRAYSFVTLAAMAIFALHLEMLRRDRLPAALWVLFAVLEALLVYAHYVAAVFLLALALTVPFVPELRRHARPWLLAQGGAALLFVPWIPTMIFCLGIAKDAHIIRDFNPLRDFAAPFALVNFGRSLTPHPSSPLYPLELAAAGAIALTVALWGGGAAWTLLRERRRSLLALLFGASLLPVAILILVCIVAIPNFNYIFTKYVIWIQVPVAFAAALWYESELARGRRWTVAISLLVFLAGNGWNETNYLWNLDYRKAPDYRRMATWLEGQATAGDAVLYDSQGTLFGMDPCCELLPTLGGLDRGVLVVDDRAIPIRATLGRSAFEIYRAPGQSCGSRRLWFVISGDWRSRRSPEFEEYARKIEQRVSDAAATGAYVRGASHAERGLRVVCLERQ